MSTLKKRDYISILKFYNLPIPKSSIQIKIDAEKIINDKLCRCIKKVNPNDEGKAIGICSKTILHRKKIKTSKFSCKKNKSIFLHKHRNSKKNRNRTKNMIR